MEIYIYSNPETGRRDSKTKRTSRRSSPAFERRDRTDGKEHCFVDVDRGYAHYDKIFGETARFPVYQKYFMKIAIIGGSGLDDPQIIQDPQQVEVENKYGKPSSALTTGKIGGVEVVILSRHGKDHSVAPTEINFRANLLALKEIGCSHILATTAVGSLREEIKPGNLVFPNQFIDFTRHRNLTFFSDKVIHTPMSEPYDPMLRSLLRSACDELGFVYNTDKTVITIEGPRFSTKAESHMFRQWGADIINMSTCPEVILANELKIPYQTIAMSTDYDCWKDDEEPVTFEIVMERMKENAQKVKQLLIKVIPKI